MENTLLLFGGSSEERMVSVASAQNIVQQRSFSKILFLTKDGALHSITKEELVQHQKPFTNEFTTKAPVLAKTLEEGLNHLQGHTVFLGFHGTQGEDGTLQAWLEENRIPFTGSGSRASRLAFEKNQAKAIVVKADVKGAPELVVSKKLADGHAKLREFLALHKKIVLKPLANGSSVGLHIIDNEKSLDQVAPEILSGKHGDYLAECFLQGRELTVGVLQEASGRLRVLPPSEVIMQQGRNFDYEGKYLGQGTTEITPADLTEEELNSAQDLALKAHEALGCFGYSRTDLMLTSAGAIFIETNTLPGLTKASFIPQQLAAANITMQSFLETQLKLAHLR